MYFVILFVVNLEDSTWIQGTKKGLRILRGVQGNKGGCVELKEIREGAPNFVDVINYKKQAILMEGGLPKLEKNQKT